MTAKKPCAYCKHGSAEHLLFLFKYLYIIIPSFIPCIITCWSYLCAFCLQAYLQITHRNLERTLTWEATLNHALEYCIICHTYALALQHLSQISTELSTYLLLSKLCAKCEGKAPSLIFCRMYCHLTEIANSIENTMNCGVTDCLCCLQVSVSTYHIFVHIYNH